MGKEEGGYKMVKYKAREIDVGGGGEMGVHPGGAHGSLVFGL